MLHTPSCPQEAGGLEGVRIAYHFQTAIACLGSRFEGTAIRTVRVATKAPVDYHCHEMMIQNRRNPSSRNYHTRNELILPRPSNYPETSDLARCNGRTETHADNEEQTDSISSSSLIRTHTLRQKPDSFHSVSSSHFHGIIPHD